MKLAKVRKRPPLLVFRSRHSLVKVKASVMRRSASGQLIRAEVGDASSFAFVPPSAKLEVLNWPKL